MTAPHDKLACGDRVRVKFEGAVIEASPNGRLVLQAHDDGTTGQYAPVIFSWSERQSPAFQIERIEPPLKVNDMVQWREGFTSKTRGVVVCIFGDHAWIMAEEKKGFATVPTSDLERIA